MRRTIYIALIVFLAINASGQQGDYYLDIKHFPFINYDDNRIVHPSHKNSFDNIYRKIDSLVIFGKGKLNIVHFGGSHIQADIYTHRLRKHLQNLSYGMNGGRGLIFPFTIAQTNNPGNYKVSYSGEWTHCKNTKYQRTCPLGVTGISVSTKDSLATITIDINRDSTIKYSFNSLKLFHSVTNYSICITNADSNIFGEYNPERGYTSFEVPESKTLNLRFFATDSIARELTLYGVYLENNEPGIVYNAIGVNGAKLHSYLYCDLLVKQLNVINPDLVIFSIGTNDGNTTNLDSKKYYNEYDELIKRVRIAAPKSSILITVPNDAYFKKRYVNKNTQILRKEIYSLAQKEGYGIWDFFNVMGGLDSSQKWYDYGLMRYDRIHFTFKGYYLKGDLLMTALLKGWEKNLAQRKAGYFKTRPLKGQN